MSNPNLWKSKMPKITRFLLVFGAVIFSGGFTLSSVEGFLLALSHAEGFGAPEARAIINK